MSSDSIAESQSPQQPAASLRLWPGIVIVVCLWLIQIWSITGEFALIKFMLGKMISPIASILGLIIWWLFATRLRWNDRRLSTIVLAVVAIATPLIAGSNFPAMPMMIYAIPILSTVWVAWLVLTIPLSWPIRQYGLACLFVLIGAVCSMLRLDGMDGSFAAEFHWRWEPTGEAQLLSELTTPRATSSVKDAVQALQPTDWPCFRGPNRDGKVYGVSITTDWEANPPKELWRHRIGPGWSSFAVVGPRVFTQEQRGEQELVVCYEARTGAEVWSHSNATRFTEVVAGAGPRATPTFHEGRIYSCGANGALNCLNAETGKLIWTQDIKVDTKAKVPQWGFSSSPLVTNNLVTVFAGGPDGKSLVAYHIEDGKLAWTAGTGLLSYCSPETVVIDDVEQILFPTEDGLTSFEPATGQVLWLHEWPAPGIARVAQPAQVAKDQILIGTGMNLGLRRITVTKNGESWSTQENWTSKEIKPYFNDFVISDHQIYGFDGPVFMSLNADDGKKTWKTRGSGKGYGTGQVLLLADQKLLLVLTEVGEIALVEANPKEFREIAKIPAISGKTWNHPVISGNILFVRNGEEAAAFELTLKSPQAPADENPEK